MKTKLSNLVQVLLVLFCALVLCSCIVEQKYHVICPMGAGHVEYYVLRKSDGAYYLLETNSKISFPSGCVYIAEGKNK